MICILASPLVLTIEIDIVKSELSKCFIELFLDVFWAMRVVPELGGDEKLFALHHGRDDAFQSSTDLRTWCISAFLA